MSNQLFSLATFFIGFLIASLSMYVVMKSKQASSLRQAQADSQVDVATDKERLRCAEQDLLSARAEKEESARQTERLRAQIEVLTTDNARLTERGGRVEILNREITALNENAKTYSTELLRLSTSEAEKAQNLLSTTTRLIAVEAELSRVVASETVKTTEMNDLNERYASLQTAASRIPGLETYIQDKETSLSALNRSLAELREDTGRLTAELKAEKDVNAAALIRHQTAAHKNSETERVLETANQKIAEMGATIRGLHAELTAAKGLLTTTEESLLSEKAFNELERGKVSQMTTELAELSVHLERERSENEEKLTLLTNAQEKMAAAFKNLATDIFDEKSKRFTEESQSNIGQLLNPLKERMSEFKSKVEEIHAKDIEQQAMLRSELSQLKDLNRQMTEEAHGLATALKGQAKTQGNWGELILGNVLDRAGLSEGKDFKREVSFNTDSGRKRPDVIVLLPQSKHLVIDAKVSLNAYTRYVNAEDEITRAQALKEHVIAISDRINELADKTYFDLPGLNTPEMVFMFIPIESAFSEALRADETLFLRAVANNILVATPTTLLTSLNIVRQLWRFEAQNIHTMELADRASKVYKKLVTFLSSMESVGSHLDKAKESYGKALGQLVQGKNNLIQQAHDFERLGVSIQAPLPETLVATALLELEELPATTHAGAIQ